MKETVSADALRLQTEIVRKRLVEVVYKAKAGHMVVYLPSMF